MIIDSQTQVLHFKIILVSQTTSDRYILYDKLAAPEEICNCISALKIVFVKVRIYVLSS